MLDLILISASIFLAPTNSTIKKNTVAQSPTFKDTSQLSGNAGFTTSNSKNRINLDSDLIEKRANKGNIFMSTEEIERLESRHYRRHRRQSQSVTFSKETFQLINQLLIEYKDTVAGIRCVLIRYDKKYKNDSIRTAGSINIPGKNRRNQNSLVFVPVDKNGEVIRGLFKPKTKIDEDGLNHGEICPSHCNGNGDGSNGGRTSPGLLPK